MQDGARVVTVRDHAQAQMAKFGEQTLNPSRLLLPDRK